MIIYIVFLSYLFLTTIFYVKSKKNKKQKMMFLIANFIPLIIISGLRDASVGIDTEQFTNAFSGIIRMEPRNFDTLRYEYGFSYLCWILGKISINPQILIFVTSAFINISVARFIYKNSDNICYSTVLYILCNFFFSYMNIMRQAIAIAIVLWGFEYLKEKKYIKFSFFVVLASFFHASAFLALLLIPLRKFNYDKKFLGVTLIATGILFLFGKEIFLLLAKFSPRLFDYVDGKFNVENYFASFLNFLVYMCSFVLGMFIISKNDKKCLKEKNEKTNVIIGIMGVAVMFSALTMRVSLFNRFTPYFSIFLIIWLANNIEKIKNTKERLLFKVIVLLMFMAYWIIIARYRTEWYGCVPYKFMN